METFYHNNVPSTNDLARRMVDAGQLPPFLVVAEQQSGGRGQYKRQFVSPVGGLYFSLVCQPSLPPERLSLTTLAVGLACCQVLQECVPQPLQLKWPNDIYLEGRKLAGILCESVSDKKGKTTVIIGVGININSCREDFSHELQNNTTTVYEITGQKVPLASLLDSLVQSICKMVSQLISEQQDVLDQWQERDYLCGRTVVYEHGDERVSGVGLGVIDDGRYSIRDRAGKKHCILSGSLQPDYPLMADGPES